MMKKKRELLPILLAIIFLVIPTSIIHADSMAPGTKVVGVFKSGTVVTAPYQDAGITKMKIDSIIYHVLPSCKVVKRVQVADQAYTEEHINLSEIYKNDELLIKAFGLRISEIIRIEG